MAKTIMKRSIPLAWLTGLLLFAAVLPAAQFCPLDGAAKAIKTFVTGD